MDKKNHFELIDISRYKIISFDIFDTLLLWPFSNPQELWTVLEEREKLKGFSKARKKADAITYERASKRGGEATIEEAYEQMPRRFRLLMQKEIDWERKVLRVNPEMLDIWHEAGKQGKLRVIVSDMYLPASFIQSVLLENGIKDWDVFFLSRDYDARKTTGKLFEAMLHTENAKPNEVLHIGDNIHSDVNVPQSLGIHTQYYPKVIDCFYEVCPFAKRIKGRLAGLLAVGWHQFKFEHPNYTY